MTIVINEMEGLVQSCQCEDCAVSEGKELRLFEKVIFILVHITTKIYIQVGGWFRSRLY